MSSEKIITTGMIPFHSYHVVKEETEFRLNDNEMNFIKGEDIRKGVGDIKVGSHRMRGFDTTKNAKILHEHPLQRVRKFIWNRVNNYVENILSIENYFYLTQSWVTFNEKGSYHHQHTHPNAIFSCVYYVQVDSGDFQLKMPFSRLQEGFNFKYPKKQDNIWNSHTFTTKVKTGDVIIFPGWVPHQSTPNMSDTTRILFASNYFIKGTIGSLKEKDEITIR